MLFRLPILLFFVLYMIEHKFQFDLHMFQQNSYKYNRYLKWNFSKNNRLWKSTDSFIFLSMFFCYLAECKIFPFHNLSLNNDAQSLNLCTSKHLLIFVLISILMIIWAEYAHKLILSVHTIKKPLVYTPRVKRLMSTQISVLIITLSFLFLTNQPSLITSVSIFALSFFSYILLIVANFINIPIEKIINNWYIADAKKILAENPNRLIIGITGSYGKTSTKQILFQLLSRDKTVLATPESYNTLMGVVKTIRESLRPIHDVFIVEMGAKQEGDIKQICELVNPNMGIITSIGPQHLETFKTLDNIKKTKNELFMNLQKNGTAFLNISDENIISLPRREDIEYIKFQTNYSLTDLSNTENSSNNTIYKSSNINITKKGTTFDLSIPSTNKKIPIQTKLLGSHNVNNILSALALADNIGINISKCVKIISSIKPIEHRLSIKYGARGETIIDDAFNSNPIGSKNALEILSAMDADKKYIITPGMIELGAKMYEYNRQFGEYIADSCDFVVLVGKKQTLPIAQGLANKNYPEENIYIASSFIEGYEYLQRTIKPSDVLLIENDLPDSFN